MKRIKELSQFIHWIIKHNIHPGGWSMFEDISFKLISMGGKENSISYEIEQCVDDERIIYTVDIQVKEVSNV